MWSFLTSKWLTFKKDHTKTYYFFSRSSFITITALVFALLLSIPNVSQVSAYDVKIDNSVDADSDEDVTANIYDSGLSSGSYIDAQSQDDSDQVIVEGQGAGYAAQENVSDTFDSYSTDIDSNPDVGIDASWGNAQATTYDSSYMTMQEANQGGAGTGGQLSSAKDTVVSDITTSTTFEDVDGLTVQLTTDYTSDILLFAAIQCELGASIDGSWRLVFDGVNYQELTRQVRNAYPGNLVLTDLVSSKSAGTYTFKVQHKVSSGTLTTSNSIIVAISLHNTEGTVPANDSFVASDTVGNSWSDVTGLTADITLSRTSHIWAMMTMCGYHSANNKDTDFAINIDGTRMEIHDRDWADPSVYGCVSVNTRTDTAKTAGTYIVKAEWKGAGGSTMTGENFSLVVIAAEANSGAEVIDIQKVVVASDTTTSTTIENIDDLNTTTITVNNTAHVLGILTLSTDVTALESAFTTINLNGIDYDVMERGHSSTQRWGSVGQVVRSDSTYGQGTANATGRWYTAGSNTLAGGNIILTTIVLYSGSAGGGGDDYELDLEYSFTTPDDDNTYEYISFYVQTATVDGDYLKAYEWDGSWQFIGDLTSDTWNNFSISYLDGIPPDFYIRFIDSDQAGETTQSTWNMDCIFLRTSNNLINDRELTWEHQVASPDIFKNAYNVTIYGFSSNASESFEIQMWNYTDSSWSTSLPVTIDTTEGWYNQSFDRYYVDNTSQEVTWRYVGDSETGDSLQTTLRIDYAGVAAWNFTVNIIETYIVIAENYSQDSGWVAFDQSPIEINVSSGEIYTVQIKGTDGTNSPIANEYLRFHTSDDAGAGTNLSLSWQNLYVDQVAGEVQLLCYFWVAVPFGIDDGIYTFTLEIQVIKS